MGIISCGLLLLVYGESHFNMVGFVVVMTASMLSGLRWTITQVLLQGTPGSSGHGASGGPVEVLLQLTPGERILTCRKSLTSACSVAHTLLSAHMCLPLLELVAVRYVAGYCC